MITDPEKRWTAVLAGMALFILWGLGLISLEIPHEWGWPIWIPFIFLISTLIVLPIGMCVGWIQGFPRWSYPYVGHVLVFCLYMVNVATPGFLFGRELWGWRAWIPLLIIAGIALIVTRSLTPIGRFFTNIWKDWTLLTFAMFGFMPLLVAIGFDEVDRLYSLYFMILITFLMCGAAFLYLRTDSQRQQVLALLAGILLTTAVTVIAPSYFWQKNGWVNVSGMVLMGGIVVLFMFSPALIGIFSGLASRKTV